MSEQHLIGNLYFNDDDIIGCSKKYGVSVLVRNRSQQGLTMPLDHLTPNDLRHLADFLEGREKLIAEKTSH